MEMSSTERACGTIVNSTCQVSLGVDLALCGMSASVDAKLCSVPSRCRSLLRAFARMQIVMTTPVLYGCSYVPYSCSLW